MMRGPDSSAGDGSVFAIGKFAGHPEFIRADVSGEAVDSFDDWLDRGSLAALERWGAAWATTFPMGVAHGFFWGTPRDATRICGVVAPSRDAVGRASRRPTSLALRTSFRSRSVTSSTPRTKPWTPHARFP